MFEGLECDTLDNLLEVDFPFFFDDDGRNKASKRAGSMTPLGLYGFAVVVFVDFAWVCDKQKRRKMTNFAAVTAVVAILRLLVGWYQSSRD